MSLTRLSLTPPSVICVMRRNRTATLLRHITAALAGTGDLEPVTRRLEWLRAHGTGAARQRRAFERRGDPTDVVDQLIAQHGTLAGKENSRDMAE